MSDPNNADLLEEQTALRLSIDNIDSAIIHMLAERFRSTRRVAVLKTTFNLAPSDPTREQQQLARLRELAQTSGLDPDFAERFLNFIIREVVRVPRAKKGR